MRREHCGGGGGPGAIIVRVAELTAALAFLGKRESMSQTQRSKRTVMEHRRMK